MRYAKAHIENGKVVETDVTNVNQNEMTSECWIVQFGGLAACDTCEFVDTDECGGEEIRKLAKNEKGFSVPLENSLKGAQD